jgi:hypothetical protein
MYKEVNIASYVGLFVDIPRYNDDYRADVFRERKLSSIY